ncbi:MAG: DUF2834 domain-containing protein [Deltaproteobacteria bacterium]|nr:DUF2834 domain-containing protein [Deltaproteobacteria bacterium]
MTQDHTRSPLRLALAAGALLAFSVFSTFVVVEHGYFGFVTEVMLGSDWGLQVFLDLCIALFLFTSWMLKDAKARSIPVWPYLLATLSLGSIGALAYLVHREVAAPRRVAPRAQVA